MIARSVPGPAMMAGSVLGFCDERYAQCSRMGLSTGCGAAAERWDLGMARRRLRSVVDRARGSGQRIFPGGAGVQHGSASKARPALMMSSAPATDLDRHHAKLHA